MRVAHHEYAKADPLFYDHPAPGSGGRRFAAADRAPADGFVRQETTGWVVHSLEGVELPAQGFKVHVSATTDDAEQIVDLVTDYCRGARVTHKFLPDHRVHLLNNSKYARRGSSGKLLTLYPADDAQLTTVLTELGDLLDGFTGPYILGDLRWRNGPLYLRYGSFVERWCTDAEGNRVLAFAQPDGTLVPDRRGPVFRLPAWVEPPSILDEQLRSHRSQTTSPLPYDVESALHFSNGGGIYLARDRSTGDRVVLREARPLAGLDGSRTDAVTRLHQEADALTALAGLDGVPRLLGKFTAWEHHYLAEEYVEGETLRHFMAHENPLVRPEPTMAEFSRYADQVLDIIGQLETTIESIHSRGYAFGDLHPANVMLRSDGRVCLVDFETTHRPGEDPPPSMGCPGFTAPNLSDGYARDRYALDSIRLSLFLPLTMLLDLDVEKLDEFVDAAGEFYPLPKGYADGVRRGLQRPTTKSQQKRASSHSSRPQWRPECPGQLRTMLARALVQSATPERTDRLYPGDPAALHDGGYNLAHGAAGVLHTLHETGHQVPEEHTEWLWQAVRRAEDPRPGLYGGLHGAALTLYRLGRPEEARETLQRTHETTDFTVHSGLAGIGITLHQLAEKLNDSRLQDQLHSITERLADRIDSQPGAGRRPGLMYGHTGLAAFFLQRYEAEGDSGLLDLARRALSIDVARCHTGEDGAVNLRDGNRLLPYLAVGSAGIALTAGRYLRHRDDDELGELVRGSLLAARARFVLYSDLFTGRAGLMTLLAANREGPDAEAALTRHLRLLSWHAIPYQGGFAFPGEQHHRLSMDLATGTAGVLHAMHVASGGGSDLPGLSPPRQNTGTPQTSAV